MTPKTPADQNRIAADPSKDFFIDMLTRDIGVVDCILDLVDNAIDKAVEQSGVLVMDLLQKGALAKGIAGAEIRIEYDSKHFRITDTCGGISVAEARNRVFRFGNPDERGASHGLSVYGIGMKRAFFKLGTVISVSSQTHSDMFDVTIDVPAWKAQPNVWAFEFQKFQVGLTNDSVGTSISIPSLRPGIGERFALPTFTADLRARIASTYSLFLRAGVKILTNGSPVDARLPTIVAEPFRPVVARLEHDGVRILIIASMSPRADRTPHGWYVFCNGRMVLEADKSGVTGWGEGMPAFHSKYNHFVGFVYFESEDVRKLPWRTTKQGVEKENPVFQAALNEMRLNAKPILDYLTDMYPADIEPEGIEERDLLDGATTVSLEKLSKVSSAFSAPARTRGKSSRVSIQFTRPRALVERIRSHIGDRNLSASRIGEHTFDYFVANELD